MATRAEHIKEAETILSQALTYWNEQGGRFLTHDDNRDLTARIEAMAHLADSHTALAALIPEDRSKVSASPNIPPTGGK